MLLIYQSQGLLLLWILNSNPLKSFLIACQFGVRFWPIYTIITHFVASQIPKFEANWWNKSHLIGKEMKQIWTWSKQVLYFNTNCRAFKKPWCWNKRGNKVVWLESCLLWSIMFNNCNRGLHRLLSVDGLKQALSGLRFKLVFCNSAIWVPAA